jgi:hypothetical protein
MTERSSNTAAVTVTAAVSLSFCALPTAAERGTRGCRWETESKQPRSCCCCCSPPPVKERECRGEEPREDRAVVSTNSKRAAQARDRQAKSCVTVAAQLRACVEDTQQSRSGCSRRRHVALRVLTSNNTQIQRRCSLHTATELRTRRRAKRENGRKSAIRNISLRLV